MKMKQLIKLIPVFLIAAAVVGVAVAQRWTRAGAWQNLTVKYESRTVSPTGESFKTGEDTRWCKANGEWREVQTQLDPKTGGVLRTATYQADKTGVYRIWNDKPMLQYEGQSAPPDYVFNESKARANTKDGPAVAGFRVLVSRTEKKGGGFIEDSFAPELNGLLVKILETYPDGGYEVREAVDIQKGTVEFAAKPDFPMRKAEGSH